MHKTHHAECNRHFGGRSSNMFVTCFRSKFSLVIQFCISIKELFYGISGKNITFQQTLTNSIFHQSEKICLLLRTFLNTYTTSQLGLKDLLTFAILHYDTATFRTPRCTLLVLTKSRKLRLSFY